MTLDDILAAQLRIADGVYLSPCAESELLSELCGCRVYCKLEYLQRTGSFKERGARNAMLLLAEPQRRGGVVAASAGNHALALAHQGKLLGIAVTVVMPTHAPLVKIEACGAMGATVILHGESFQQAVEKARVLEREGRTYIHGYDDPAIIAGAGTIGLEIAEQVPTADALLVPVGGAGLIAGVSLAIKSRTQEMQIIGVQAAAAPGLETSMRAGQPVTIETGPTLADGLAVNRVGALAMEIAQRHVDRIVTVEEDAIALAVLRLLELEKGVVEGAGATTLAALISHKLPDLRGKTVVLLLTGGNIDPLVMATVIEKGLAADGRLWRFTATISDRPGGLAKLTAVIAAAGASIHEVHHDRIFSGSDIAAVNVLCIVETRNRRHIADLHNALTAAGIRFLPQP